jgi:hypothetical protein
LDGRGSSLCAVLFAGASLLVTASGCAIDLEGLGAVDDGGTESSTDATGSSDSGGDVSTPDSSPGVDSEAGDGSSAADSGDGAGSEGEGGEGGSDDGGASCPSATPSPCVNPNTGNNDFCSNDSACDPCIDVADDMNCTTAYGSASSAYLCLAGACSPGDCRTNGDCATNARGSLCGVTTPNLCGTCTADSQCASVDPTTPVCDTTTGQCASGACTPSASNPPAACPVNSSDICCTGVCQASGEANACCPGPGANAYCAALLGNNAAACIGAVCTACPVVTGTAYSVDPVQGSDQAGTGNASVAGCAFKTITRALQVVGKSPLLATTIRVLGPSTVNAGETFPVVVPANVVITTSLGPVTVKVPAMQAGFSLAAANSGIAGGPGASVTIDGQNAIATYAIVASTGSRTTTLISNLTVTGFLDDGILVNTTGTLSIGPGVTSTSNGTAAARKSGLHVTAGGHAIIDVPLGSAPAHFDANTSHGILVDGSGYVTLTGAVTSATAGAGTVTANANFAAGLWVSQTPGAPPPNVITGLVSFGATSGNGMRFLAGSNVKLRGSVSLNNQASGVLVSGAAASNDVAQIDLGNPTGGDYGNNTFQEPAGSANNGGAGICLSLTANSGTLLGAGNVFGAVNCAAGTGMLTINRGACGNAACAGRICDLGVIGPGNDINVARCVHP